MKPRIIIADDSQTIQKVIKITLANEEFELVECLNDESLMGLVQENNPSLVLLDFNLSENKTGYDLAKEVKSIGGPKIMMLYGTFDTIDESLLDESGVNGHIIKPFDGNKFINLCRQLISDSELEGESENELESEIELESFDDSTEELEDFVEDENSEIEIGDEWVVNQPDSELENLEENDDISDEVVTTEELNTLEAGMQDWGIDVPGVIGSEDNAIELPPVIGEDSSFEKSVEEIESDFNADATQEISRDILLENSEDDGFEEDDVVEEAFMKADNEEIVIPEEDDLEYPDSDKIKEEVANEESFSQLTPITDLADEVEFSDNEEIQGIALDDTLGTNTEEEVKILEEQIADEMDEEQSLWSTDEVVDEADLGKTKLELAIEKAKGIVPSKEPEEEVQEIAEQEPAAVQQPVLTQAPQVEISEADIQARVEEMLAPMVERMVKEKVDSIIEKISWEVIPDLAENLIKKELKQISEDVLQDN